jgi:hypothetical protein
MIINPESFDLIILLKVKGFVNVMAKFFILLSGLEIMLEKYPLLMGIKDDISIWKSKSYIS